jgi:hypothetical protein
VARVLTKAQATTLVREGSGYRRADTGIEDALAWAQDQLERGQTLPWFLREEDDELSGTANNGQVALPTGFIREDEENEWWVEIDDVKTRLVKKSWAFVREHRQDPTTGDDEEGTPIYYAIRNSVIEVSPVPSENYTIVATYFKNATAIASLGSGDSNAWLTNGGDILWSMAGIFLAKKLRDKESLEFFSDVYQAAEKLLKNEIAEREAANREYVMGSGA